MKPGDSFPAIATGIAFLIAMYFYTNATWDLVPGVDPSAPAGWWAWNDQGEYLRSAKAFLRGDLSGSQHLYPPLYPLIGAAFLPFGDQNPFFWPDLAFEIGYFVLFVRLFRRALGAWGAAACALAGMLLFAEFRVLWVMPLTTTPSAFFFLCLLGLFDRCLALREAGAPGAQAGNAALFGLVVGLLAADRPVDVGITAPISIAYAVVTLMDTRKFGARRTAIVAAAGIVSFCVPFFLFLAFNLVSYGALFGRYLAQNSQMGWDPSYLPMSFYSEWLNSAPFFAEAGVDWAHKMPIVLLAVAFLPAALFSGPLAYRLAAVCGLLQFLVYYCDHDIQPVETFRFAILHYFKWLAPVAIALACVALRSLVAEAPELRRRAVLAVASVGAIALFACSLEAVAETEPLQVVASGEHDLRLELGGREVTYIDVPGVTGKWRGIYFAPEAFIQLDDGVRLVHTRDFRFLPTASGFRALLMKPAAAKVVSIHLGDNMVAGPAEEIRPTGSRMHFAFGLPRAFWR